MRDFDEGAVTDVNIRIGEETIPEKQTMRYLGVFFGAQDILPGSPQMRHAGWKPAQSAWLLMRGRNYAPRHHQSTLRPKCRSTVPVSPFGSGCRSHYLTANMAQRLWCAPASRSSSVRKPMLAKRSSICGPEIPWHTPLC